MIEGSNTFGNAGGDYENPFFIDGTTPAEMLRSFHAFAPETPNIILAVEDTPSIAMLFNRLLSKQFPGFDIRLFPDAESALDFVETREEERQKVAAVFADRGLPGISGTELLRALNGSQNLSRSLPPHVANELKGKPMFLHTDSGHEPDHGHDDIRHVKEKGYVHGHFKKLPKPEVFVDAFRQGLLRAMKKEHTKRGGGISQ